MNMRAACATYTESQKRPYAEREGEIDLDAHVARPLISPRIIAICRTVLEVVASYHFQEIMRGAMESRYVVVLKCDAVWVVPATLCQCAMLSVISSCLSPTAASALQPCNLAAQ